MKVNGEGPGVWPGCSSLGWCVCVWGRGVWSLGDPMWLKEGVTVIPVLLRLTCRLTCQRALIPGEKVCLQRHLKQTAHFTSFLGSQFKSHDDFVSSWHIFFLITHRFQRRGLWLRRAGKGNPLARACPRGALGWLLWKQA